MSRNAHLRTWRYLAVTGGGYAPPEHAWGAMYLSTFKRYVAAHVNCHFTWPPPAQHGTYVALTVGLWGAYMLSHVAPTFPPSTAWVLTWCRSIRGNSATPRVPMRMWQCCAASIYAVRGFAASFFNYVFFFY